MPVNVEKLHELLTQSEYNQTEIDFLINGFTEGFSIGYDRKETVQMTSPNLKLRIGNETILWNKIMKEVKEKRYAGPFSEIPYEGDYIQSPIGLVPKDNGKKCRLIFHLLYPRN